MTPAPHWNHTTDFDGVLVTIVTHAVRIGFVVALVPGVLIAASLWLEGVSIIARFFGRWLS